MFSPVQEERKSHNLRFLAIILAIVLVLGFVFLKPVWGVYRHSSNAKRYIEKAEEELRDGNFAETSFYLKLAHKDFLKARKDVKRLAWYKSIPWLGKQIVALENLIISSSEITASLNDLSQIASDILNPLEGSLDQVDGDEKSSFLKKLSESTRLLNSMRSRLAQASQDLGKISTAGLLPQISKTIDVVRNKLPLMQDTVENLILISKILPNLAGYPEEKTYLFLFQNNTELRPAGGFIGTYGILKLKNGEITHFFTDDSYNLDKNFESEIETPLPYQLYNKRYKWYFRDSNWSPDFREAAKKAEWFYHLEGGEEDLDGVIAITPTFVEKLLKLTGPIKVEGYPYEFNSENFTDQLEFHVEKNFYKFEGKTYRKSIIGSMGEVLLARASALPREKLAGLFKVISQSFVEKHFLIYLDDPKHQSIIEEANWDGRVKAVESDYLMYVDCNLASLKSDPKVERSIDYEVHWDGKDRPVVRLEMTYNHKGDFDWKTTRYRTYARVYVPLGSKLLNVKGNESEVSVYEEFGKTVFAFFKVIEPRTQESVVLEYKLPQNLASQSYSLYAQKQAGTYGHKLDVRIDWDGESQEISTDLVRDREFRL